MFHLAWQELDQDWLFGFLIPIYQSLSAGWGTIPDRCAYWGCALLIQASTTPMAQSTKQCSAPAHPIHFVKFRTAIQVLVAIPNSCFPFISSYHSLLILTVACLSPILCILCSKWWANSSLVHSCQPAFQQPPAAPSSKAPDDFGRCHLFGEALQRSGAGEVSKLAAGTA